MQFADFVSTGFNPIVNLLAQHITVGTKKLIVVVRMPCGGVYTGWTFSLTTNEAWFTKNAGT